MFCFGFCFVFVSVAVSHVEPQCVFLTKVDNNGLDYKPTRGCEARHILGWQSLLALSLAEQLSMIQKTLSMGAVSLSFPREDMNGYIYRYLISNILSDMFFLSKLHCDGGRDGKQ